MLLALSPLVLVGLAVAGLWVEPDPRGFGTHERLGMPPCLPMELWNVPCPGCGVTTALVLAAHGSLLGSLRAQPFGLIVAMALLAFSVWAPLAHLRGRDLWHDLVVVRLPRLGPVLAALLVLSWLYKVVAVRG